MPPALGLPLAEVEKCRRDHNRLGFAYQVAFVRLFSLFPAQQPLEICDELLNFVAMQMKIDGTSMEWSWRFTPTIREALRSGLLVHRGRVWPAAREGLQDVEIRGNKASSSGGPKNGALKCARAGVWRMVKGKVAADCWVSWFAPAKGRVEHSEFASGIRISGVWFGFLNAGGR